MCDRLEVVPLTARSFGAEIRGLNLTSAPLTPECQSQVFSIWNEYSVVLIRNQFNMSEEALFHFAQGLGEPKPAGSRGYYLREGNPHGSGRSSPIPEVSVMSNLDSSGNPQAITGGHGSQSVDWHQDDSYTNTPARGALLYNTFHPLPKPYPTGNTSFCDLYRAYETFDASKKEELKQWHLVHDISRNSAYHVRPGLTLPKSYDDVVGPAHPLVITHPLTGRKALHLGRNPPAPSSYILEQNHADGHRFFQDLWDHATSSENTWSHTTWRPGDLLIWDNLATMHKRSLVDPSQRREMLRVLLRGPSEGLVGPSQLKTIRTTANDKADAEAREAANMGGIKNDAHVSSEEETYMPENSLIPDTPTLQIEACNMAGSCEANGTNGAALSKHYQMVNDSVILLKDFMTNHITTMTLVVATMWVGLFFIYRKKCKKGSLYSIRISTQIDHSSTRSYMTLEDKTPRVEVVTAPKSEHIRTIKSKQELATNPFAYLAETRVQVFWWSFLGIFLFFQSFSCGRADRLWRISHIFENSPKVLLKPYGISSFWYASLLPYLHHIETAVLFMMILLGPASPQSPVLLQLRRLLSLGCGLGWLFLHGYEHSMTGGSHTHLMPAICMIAMGVLPAPSSWNMIRWWNMFLLFSAGISKLFNGYPHSHPMFGAWMDGQSMQFYFLNSRQAVPEPWNTLTMNYDWFAAIQCTGSVFLELSTCLLFWQPYRLVFPFLGMAFHGIIWYTLGVNYLTSVIIQFTLVLDADDWKCLRKYAIKALNHVFRLMGHSNPEEIVANSENDTNTNTFTTVKQSKTYQLPTPPLWARAVVWVNVLVMMVVIITQMEFWPLSNIPMYSGYRPKAGFNTTHIANMTYLENLVSESAPHVWSRHWTDIMVHISSQTEQEQESFKMSFCVPSPDFDPLRGVKEFCLVPEKRHLDTERESHNTENQAYRLDASSEMRHSIRVGGWNRQKPMVVVAEMLHRNNKNKINGRGRQHTYCRHEYLSPAEDFLLRNCVFLKSFPQMAGKEIHTELVVHLGTGEDLVLGSMECRLTQDYPEYVIDQVPPCVQSPWH